MWVFVLVIVSRGKSKGGENLFNQVLINAVLGIGVDDDDLLRGGEEIVFGE